jgi:hypothetical protein
MRLAGTQEPAVTHESPPTPRPLSPAGTRAARLSEALALMGKPRQTDEPQMSMGVNAGVKMHQFSGAKMHR